MIQLPTIPINNVPQGGIYVGKSESTGEWHVNIIVGRHSDNKRITEGETLCGDFKKYISFIMTGYVEDQAIWMFPNAVNSEVWFTGIVIPIRKLRKEDVKRLNAQVKQLKKRWLHGEGNNTGTEGAVL